jgi:hypothetical protein
MTTVLPTVLNLFVALAGPHGTTMYVAPSQIVAIIGSPDVGACPTTLIRMSQPVYVCESECDSGSVIFSRQWSWSRPVPSIAPSDPLRR